VSPAATRRRSHDRRRVLTPVLLGVSLLLCASASLAGPRAPELPPTLVIVGPGGEERTIQVNDLRFAFFERSYYQRAAPRDQEASGKRLEVGDRRRECRCVRFADWSKETFKKLRQIEITYPPADDLARLRLTFLDGRVREIAASGLFGADNLFAPRFTATIDGAVREFLLKRRADPESTWPEERLVRILLHRHAPTRRR